MATPHDPRAVAFLVTLILATPLSAQPLREHLPVGARIRVAAPPRIGWVVGRLADADSTRIVLWVTRAASPDTIPLTHVRALEVSRGRPRELRTTIGMLVGGVGLAATAAFVTNARVRGQEEGAFMTGAAAVAGFVGGVIAGGTVAGRTAPERWRRVPIP